MGAQSDQRPVARRLTGRDERGNFDIFTINVGNGEANPHHRGTRQQQPSLVGPNARALTYKSSRGGIWVSTFDGKTERQVYRGAARPVWGPMRTP